MTKIKKSSREIQNWTVTLVYILQLIGLFYQANKNRISQQNKFSLYKHAFIVYNIDIKNLSTWMIPIKIETIFSPYFARYYQYKKQFIFNEFTYLDFG